MTGIRRLTATFAIFALALCAVVGASDREDVQQVFQDPHGVDIKFAPSAAGPSLKDIL
jgi:hypothetical protein